ncbi:MAG: hypothetical protein ISR65_11840 [Bacteriovoracaceae bacterium]|nr:hypothetical protein [Bacteriovoracaceae bacterium]
MKKNTIPTTLTILLGLLLIVTTSANAVSFKQVKVEQINSTLIQSLYPLADRLQENSYEFNGSWSETSLALFKVTPKNGQPEDKMIRQLIWKESGYEGVDDVDGSLMEEFDHRFVYDMFVDEFVDDMTETHMRDLDYFYTILGRGAKSIHIKVYLVGFYGSYYSGSFGHRGMAIYNDRTHEVLLITLGSSE